MIDLPKWLISYFRAPFIAIVWVMETYRKNRERLRTLMALPLVVKIFKMLLAVTLLSWLTLAFMANEEQKERLTNAIRDVWSYTQKDSDKL